MAPKSALETRQQRCAGVAPSIERCAANKVMQRARRPDRPVTTKWPGGQMQRRGRATTNEPTCIRRRLEIKVFQGRQRPFLSTGNAAGSRCQILCNCKRMAFVSHPHPTPPRCAGETARPWPAPSAFSRCAVACRLRSLRARGRLVRGSAGAAAAVTAGSLRETSSALHRDRID